jgi:hypothetical protein
MQSGWKKILIQNFSDEASSKKQREHENIYFKLISRKQTKKKWTPSKSDIIAGSSFIDVWPSNCVTRISGGPILECRGRGYLFYCVPGYAVTEYPADADFLCDNAAVLRDRIKGTQQQIRSLAASNLLQNGHGTQWGCGSMRAPKISVHCLP